MEHRDQSHEQNALTRRDANERRQLRPNDPTDTPRTAHMEGSPMTPEDAERRFADPVEAASDALLSAHISEKPMPFEELQRRCGRDADAAADRILSREFSDDPRFEATVQKLKAIEGLEPERWSTAEPHDRQAAIREANRALAESVGQPSAEVIFTKMNNPLETLLRRDGNWPGFHRPNDPCFIELNDDFLEKERFPHPREALTALCHEYRHVYQNDVLANDGRGATESIPEVSSWSRNAAEGAYIQPEKDFSRYQRQPLERDSRAFAEEICRRLYGT
jgi:hypothetical protein